MPLQDIPSDLDEDSLQNLDLLFAQPEALFISILYAMGEVLGNENYEIRQRVLDDANKLKSHGLNLNAKQREVVDFVADGFTRGLQTRYKDFPREREFIEQAIEILDPFITPAPELEQYLGPGDQEAEDFEWDPEPTSQGTSQGTSRVRKYLRKIKNKALHRESDARKE